MASVHIRPACVQLGAATVTAGMLLLVYAVAYAGLRAATDFERGPYPRSPNGWSRSRRAACSAPSGSGRSG